MRMWLVDPKILCREHLLGEHLEMHMFAGHFRKGRALGGYAPMCETDKIASRHDALATEMERRGYKHKSPLDFVPAKAQGKIDRAASLAELIRRCPACARRHSSKEQS